MPERMRTLCKKPVYLALVLMLLVVVLTITFGKTGQTNVQTELEARLESILSCVEGAGRVRVLIHCSTQESINAWSLSFTQGRVDNEIIGVLIVADGAGNAAVSAKLAQATGAVLGIDQSCIEIYCMEPNR